MSHFQPMTSNTFLKFFVESLTDVSSLYPLVWVHLSNARTPSYLKTRIKNLSENFLGYPLILLVNNDKNMKNLGIKNSRLRNSRLRFFEVIRLEIGPNLHMLLILS